MSHSFVTRVLFFSFLPACALPAPEPAKVAVAAIVLDTSVSTNITERCAELIVRVNGYLHAPGVRRLDVAVFMTGDAKSNYQPRVLPWHRFAPSGQLFEEPGAAGRAYLAFLKQLLTDCKTAITATGSSPIYTAIYQARASVVAHCAEISSSGRAACSVRFLAVHSDLIETVEPGLVGRLARVRRRRQPLPAPLDLSGFTVNVCGTAAHHAGKGERRIAPSLVEETWREIFRPVVPFDATCPTSGGNP